MVGVSATQKLRVVEVLSRQGTWPLTMQPIGEHTEVQELTRTEHSAFLKNNELRAGEVTILPQALPRD